MSGYLDGDLATLGRERMERHVGECRECRCLVADLRVILNGLHRLPAPSGGVDAVQIAASVRLRLRGPPIGSEPSPGLAGSNPT
jgi:anti-sigma factor RsiW